MTIQGQRTPRNGRADHAPHDHLSESPLQAYVRWLHENSPRNDAEPVRGRDPWLGLSL